MALFGKQLGPVIRSVAQVHCLPLENSCTINQNVVYLEIYGRVAEWLNAAVLKTVDCKRSGGSNPSSSADDW